MTARRTAGAPRLAALDGLRLVAALAVAVYHYTAAWRIDGVRLPQHFLPGTVPVSVWGFLGVELFFLISGFVICMSCWGRGLGEFFVSRVSRLYPAYWAAVLITGAVALAFPLGDRPSLGQILINLTMLQQPLGVPPVDTVYWTLFVELRFYLIMALILRRGLTYRRAVLLCAVWMTAAVLAPALDNPLLTILVIPDYAPYFVGGVALFLIHRFGPSPLLYGITGLAWLVSLARVQDRIGTMNPGFPLPDWPGFLIITACYAILLLIALGHTRRITWRWLSTAGALTYPFYLLHLQIGQTVIRAAYRHSGIPVPVLVTGTILLLLALSWCVHRAVERPLARKLRAGLRRGVAEVAAADTPKVRWPRTTDLAVPARRRPESAVAPTAAARVPSGEREPAR